MRVELQKANRANTFGVGEVATLAVRNHPVAEDLIARRIHSTVKTK